MAIKNTKYSKTFISETRQEDISIHGSAIWKYHQGVSEEDTEFRQRVMDTFAFEYDGEHKEGKGFDGRILYSFEFYGTPHTDKKDSKKNVEYQAEACIKKAGDEKELDSWTDLEKFLVKNGFKQVKDSE